MRIYLHRQSALSLFTVATALAGLLAARADSRETVKPPAVPPVTAVCGIPLQSASLPALPQIEVSALPVDDQGLHEIILRVRRAGQRFCYRYTFNGAVHNVSPVLRVHRGERFALRIVNELSGPAPGATMNASALQPCLPAAMPAMKPRAFVGYLNHTLYERSSVMPPTDVNIHLHGFQGPASQENIFLSTLSTPAHACEYDITIPRTQPPGTYFYHPHAHGMAGIEVAGGLTGMWIVEPDKPQIPRADEHAILLRAEVRPFSTIRRCLRGSYS
jgi:FtsP/CotA-like multicopper oxidase with cupredoxin domain